MTVNVRFGAAAIGALIFLTACSNSTQRADSTEPVDPAACPDLLKFQEVRYAARDKADDLDAPLGTALKGECSDVSPATGVSFPETAESVQVWSLPGVNPRLAIGAKGSEGAALFYLAEGISEQRANRITRKVGDSG